MSSLKADFDELRERIRHGRERSPRPVKLKGQRLKFKGSSRPQAPIVSAVTVGCLFDL